MKKNRKWMKKIVCLGAVVTMSLSTLTGCGSKGSTEVKDFAAYAQEVEGIKLPEEVRIVALGEATHGNIEFQELKLDVFTHLVETTAVRGFALEGDFGGCALANQYILYDEGTAEEAVKSLGLKSIEQTKCWSWYSGCMIIIWRQKKVTRLDFTASICKETCLV